jgi:DNA-binding NtrC family response regulator
VSRDVTERTEPVDRARKAVVAPYFFLAIEGGRVAGGGVRVALGGVRRVRLGRGDARSLHRDRDEVALLVPDVRMSSDHAWVVEASGGFALEDRGSTNGSIVNGVPLAAGAMHTLRDGDLVELGQTVFLYRELATDEAHARRDLEVDGARADAGLTTLDPELSRRLDLLSRVAASPISLLLHGETGTGKEVLARAIHRLSGRPGPFVAVNCGAIPANLVESHLFGHVRGGFSGAVKDEPGVVRSAPTGTLLLDEIGDLPASSQAALLRVLAEGEVVPVGSAQVVRVDVRILAATHVSLDRLIDAGGFRRDLYARLAGYVFTLPPLRERTMDLGLLAASMLASGTLDWPAGMRLHREASRALLRHDWPMNVRELAQCLRAAGALAEDGKITVDDLPASVQRARGETAVDERTSPADEALRRELLARFAEAKGNVSDVARAMGKARQQIQRWVRRFGIDPERFRELRRKSSSEKTRSRTAKRCMQRCTQRCRAPRPAPGARGNWPISTVLGGGGGWHERCSARVSGRRIDPTRRIA